MTELKPEDRINELLQEIRIVLPGTQALLGFQFIAFFNASFKELSSHLQIFHLLNLILTTIGVVLLIAPVAYQELRDGGKVSQHWLGFTRRMIALAMLCLLFSLAGDVFIASTLIETHMAWLSWLASGVVFVAGSGLWFLHVLIHRWRD